MPRDWRSHIAVPLIAAASALPVHAFPEGSSTPSGDEIRSHVSDKVFTVDLASGTSWRIEYASSGYFFVDVSTGGKAKGEWRPEDGKLCSKLQGQGDFSCSEARMKDGLLYIRRAADGELIKLVPR